MDEALGCQCAEKKKRDLCADENSQPENRSSCLWKTAGAGVKERRLERGDDGKHQHNMIYQAALRGGEKCEDGIKSAHVTSVIILPLIKFCFLWTLPLQDRNRFGMLL